MKRMESHPCFMDGDRPDYAERLPVGVRVRHDYGRWEHSFGGRYVKNLEWAKLSWAGTRMGVVVKREDYSPFPDTHSWGCPVWATPVRFDGEEKATWIRTVCLDAIGWEEKTETVEPELGLVFA